MISEELLKAFSESLFFRRDILLYVNLSDSFWAVAEEWVSCSPDHRDLFASRKSTQ